MRHPHRLTSESYAHNLKDCHPVDVTLAVVASIFGGLLLAVAFPPWGWWWAAPLACAVLLGVTATGAAGRGWLPGAVFGASFHGLLLVWLTQVGIDAWLLVTAVMAVWSALLGRLLYAAGRLRGWPWWAGGCWAAIEMGRGRFPLGGLPWGRLGHASLDGPLAGFLPAVGGTGVTVATVVIGACLLTVAGLPATRAGASPSRRRRWAAVAVVGTVAFGGVVSTSTSDGEPSKPPVTVAVVQAGRATTGQDPSAVGLPDYVDATVATGQSRPRRSLDLVVWPENATDQDPFTDPTVALFVQRGVDALAAPTLLGAILGDPQDSSRARNQALLWWPSGDGPPPMAVYTKRRLVPFGEYVPLRGLLAAVIPRIAQVPRDYVPGDLPGVVDIRGTQVGLLICYDIAYDTAVTATADLGVDLLVVQTNNATYTGTAQPWQQLAISRVRAIEYRTPVVVAATTGVSAVINVQGRVQWSAPDGQRAVGYLNVTPRRGRSPTAGAALDVTAALAAMVVVIVAMATRRTARAAWAQAETTAERRRRAAILRL